MKAVIITESYLPHIGGVEKHIASVLPYLEAASFEINIISKREILHGQKTRKFLGLCQIWLAIAKKINLIRQADVIFIHDVFIYYLPFRLIFPKKKVITTFHGWEKIYPIPFKNILYKKLAQKLSNQTISIGSYINKYYSLKEKSNHLSYGAVTLPKDEINLNEKKANSFLFIGRLEKDNGLSIFLDFLNILKEKNIIFDVKFCGDGPMREQCQSYGQVLGFTSIEEHLRKSQYCFAGGYLSILEAMAYKNIVLSAYQNNLKKDYLLDSPFAKNILCAENADNLFKLYSESKKQTSNLIEKNYFIAKDYSFEKLANLYIELSKS